jgi:hypothetical protein
MERLFGLPSMTARDAAANDFLHLLSGEQPRATPATLPPPADSGFDCGSRLGPADPHAGLDPALRGFVQLAAILEARLELAGAFAQPDAIDECGEVAAPPPDQRGFSGGVVGLALPRGRADHRALGAGLGEPGREDPAELVHELFRLVHAAILPAVAVRHGTCHIAGGP